MGELISIIVPIYNVEKYLNRCIDSLLKQSYKNIEIILVDDGSKDLSSKIADDYGKKDTRVKVIHKKNGGVSDARNVGLKNSQGLYITFVDSDDYVTNNYIMVLYNTIKKYNADISICSYQVWYDSGRVLKKGVNKEGVYNREQALKKMLYHKEFDVSPWGKMYKRELFNNIEYPVGRIFEDAAITYKLILKSNKIAYDYKEEYFYMIRQKSITTYEFDIKKMDLITSTQEMYDEISQKIPKLKKAAKRRLVYAYLSTLSQLVQSNGNHPKQEKMIYKFLKENGMSILFDFDAPIRDKIRYFIFKFWNSIL